MRRGKKSRREREKKGKSRKMGSPDRARTPGPESAPQTRLPAAQADSFPPLATQDPPTTAQPLYEPALQRSPPTQPPPKAEGAGKGRGTQTRKQQTQNNMTQSTPALSPRAARPRLIPLPRAPHRPIRPTLLPSTAPVSQPTPPHYSTMLLVFPPAKERVEEEDRDTTLIGCPGTHVLALDHLGDHPRQEATLTATLLPSTPCFPLSAPRNSSRHSPSLKGRS